MGQRSDKNMLFGLTRRRFLAGAGTATLGTALSRPVRGASGVASFDSPLLLSADGPMLAAAFASLGETARRDRARPIPTAQED
jgi:hypothetical protein